MASQDLQPGNLPAENAQGPALEDSLRPAGSLAPKVAVAIGAMAGLLVIIRLATVSSFSFDELLHAHLSWLFAVGEVPYRDFAVNHFPFLWMVVAPIARLLPEHASSVEVLRGMAILWNTIFLGSLAAIICSRLEPGARPWALACFGLVTFSPAVIPYLIEFRPDPLGNALLFSGLLLFHTKAGSRRWLFLAGFLAGSAVLINTKCIFFPAVLGAIAFLSHLRRYRECWRQGVAIAAGGICAVIAGVSLMAAFRIPMLTAWQMVIAYNAAIERLHTQGFGLALAIAQHPFELAYAVAGLAALAYLLAKQRRLPDLLSVTILGFLIVNLLGNTRPWKQYYVPWLLLAAFFPARALPVLICRGGVKLQWAVALLIATIGATELVRGCNADPEKVRNLAEQKETMEWMLQHVPRDGFVVAAFDRHPVFRRDTFFKSDVDLMNNGRDAIQEYMPQFVDGATAGRLSVAGYARDLEARPPAVIVPRSCTKPQGEALEAYLGQHAGEYLLTNLPGMNLPIVLRKAPL